MHAKYPTLSEQIMHTAQFYNPQVSTHVALDHQTLQLAHSTQITIKAAQSLKQPKQVFA